jgi:hypothetical protein
LFALEVNHSQHLWQHFAYIKRLSCHAPQTVLLKWGPLLTGGGGRESQLDMWS